MGHRALIAYERPNGQYNLHYSHWGGLELQLEHELTERTPYGTDEETSDLAEAFQSALSADRVTDVWVPAEYARTRVDIEPIAVDVSFDEIRRERVDYFMHEAVYVVDQAFDVTSYRTFWFGLQYEADSIESSETYGNGALRTVRWYEGEPVGDGYARGRFQGVKDVVGELIDWGVLDAEMATAFLTESLLDWRGDEELWVDTPTERGHAH